MQADEQLKQTSILVNEQTDRRICKQTNHQKANQQTYKRIMKQIQIIQIKKKIKETTKKCCTTKQPSKEIWTTTKEQQSGETKQDTQINKIKTTETITIELNQI